MQKIVSAKWTFLLSIRKYRCIEVGILSSPATHIPLSLIQSCFRIRRVGSSFTSLVNSVENSLTRKDCLIPSRHLRTHSLNETIVYSLCVIVMAYSRNAHLGAPFCLTLCNQFANFKRSWHPCTLCWCTDNKVCLFASLVNYNQIIREWQTCHSCMYWLTEEVAISMQWFGRPQALLIMLLAKKDGISPESGCQYI